jgi:hypothetical protein
MHESPYDRIDDGTTPGSSIRSPDDRSPDDRSPDDRKAAYARDA